MRLSGVHFGKDCLLASFGSGRSQAIRFGQQDEPSSANPGNQPEPSPEPSQIPPYPPGLKGKIQCLYEQAVIMYSQNGGVQADSIGGVLGFALVALVAKFSKQGDISQIGG